MIKGENEVQIIHQGIRSQGLPRAKVPTFAAVESKPTTSSDEHSQPGIKDTGRAKWTLLYQASSPADLLKFVHSLREEGGIRATHSYSTMAGPVQRFACSVRECGYMVRVLKSGLTVETMHEHCHSSAGPTALAKARKRKRDASRKGWTSSADRLRGARLSRLVRHCQDELGLVPLTQMKTDQPTRIQATALHEAPDAPHEESSASHQAPDVEHQAPEVASQVPEVVHLDPVPPQAKAIAKPPTSRRASKGKVVRKAKSDDSLKWQAFEERLDLLIGLLAAKGELCQCIESKLYGMEANADLNALEQHLQGLKYVCYLIKCAIKKVVSLPPTLSDVSDPNDCSFCHRSTDSQPFANCANSNCHQSFHIKCIDFPSVSTSTSKSWRCAECSVLYRCLQKVNDAMGTSCETFDAVVAAIAEEDFVWEDWDPRSVFDPEKAVESMIRGKVFKAASRGSQYDDSIKGHEHRMVSEFENNRSLWEVFELRVWSLLQELLRELHFYGTYTHRRRDHEYELIDARELKEYRRRISLKQEEIQGIFHEILALHAGDRMFPQLGIEDENGEVDLEVLYCSRCGSSDEPGNDIIVCDKEGCCRAYHQNCLTPSIDAASAESDTWFCWECETVNECLAWINDACGTSFRGVGDLFVEEDEIDRQLRLEGYREEDDEDYHPEANERNSSKESGSSSNDSDSDYASEDLHGPDDRFEGGSDSSSQNCDVLSSAGVGEGRTLRRSTLIRHVGSIDVAESDSSVSDEDFDSDTSSLCDYTDYREMLSKDGNRNQGLVEGEGSGETGRASDTDFDSEKEGSDSSQSTTRDDSEESTRLKSQRSSRSRGGVVVEGINFNDDYNESDSEADEISTDSVENSSTSSSSTRRKRKLTPTDAQKRMAETSTESDLVSNGSCIRVADGSLCNARDSTNRGSCAPHSCSSNNIRLAPYEKVTECQNSVRPKDNEPSTQPRSAHPCATDMTARFKRTLDTDDYDAEIEILKFTREIPTIDLTQDSD